MKPTCESCWCQIEGYIFELEGVTMCENCFEYHDGFTTVEMMNQKFSETNYEWIGWYQLDNGNIMMCDEFVGSSSWEKEWEGEDPLPDGAVYYEIYNKDMEEVDGGVMGYMNGDTFATFIQYVSECHQGLIECKIPDPEE